jgi:PIN domain nuclease of toxin-antitoxin system
MTSVVDASVVLAWLRAEPGAESAERHLMEGRINAVNWSEVLQKARHEGTDPELVGRMLTSFGLDVVDVIKVDGERAAALWQRRGGLSLADRHCLATADRLGLPAVTADRRWADVDIGAEVVVIR